MTFRDLVVISGGNLRRMKLRTFLTSAGVLIAIAAFVSMLSFGAGSQQNIERQFNKLGLFTTMQVYEKDNGREDRGRGGREKRDKENKNNGKDADSAVAKLDRDAVERISKIPGVNLAYPYDAFSVEVHIGDTTVESKAQALASVAFQTKIFSTLAYGTAFSSDTSRQVILSESLLKKAGIDSPKTLIGKPIVVMVKVSTIDSGLTHILVDKGESLFDRAKRIHYDSLLNKKYRSTVLRTEANELVKRFVNGFLNARSVIRDTLILCGVRESGERTGRLRVENVIIPIETAQRFKTGGLGGSPMDIMMAFMNGTLFASPEKSGNESFSQITIDFDPKVPYTNIKNAIEAMGYRTFSFAAEFEEIQKVFLYFDMALGLIGFIALVTASLGIVNTMVMSINERRREIGILKSLGAHETDIRALFLVESGVIGFLGTTAGIFFGWTITRIAAAIAKHYMEQEGIPGIDLFALPFWLIGIALAVGIGVSVVAGLYPAARAARVDPVAALRND
ncbi:MAG TPA: FtsX-like permease family protein [Bacteroidota bacterium]|nr:FtsX-like permease family protein [Bacteroidota bacterium]